MTVDIWNNAIINIWGDIMKTLFLLSVLICTFTLSASELRSTSIRKTVVKAVLDKHFNKNYNFLKQLIQIGGSNSINVVKVLPKRQKQISGIGATIMHMNVLLNYQDQFVFEGNVSAFKTINVDPNTGEISWNWVAKVTKTTKLEVQTISFQADQLAEFLTQCAGDAFNSGNFRFSGSLVSFDVTKEFVKQDYESTRDHFDEGYDPTFNYAVEQDKLENALAELRDAFDSIDQCYPLILEQVQAGKVVGLVSISDSGNFGGGDFYYLTYEIYLKDQVTGKSSHLTVEYSSEE